MTNWYELFRPREEPPREITPRHSGDGASRYGDAALERECEAVSRAPKGARNDTLNRAAFNLAQLIASGHLDPELVHSKLTNAAALAGLGPAEIQATLASGHRAGAALPRVVEPREPLAEVHVLRAPEQPEGADGDPVDDGGDAPEGDVETWVRSALPLVDWYELWDAEDDEEWIVWPVIPARRLVALYSPPKVGKSLFMLELAAAVAAGRNVLGAAMERPRRVLYLDFENDPRGDIRPRLEAMGYGPEDLEGLAYLSFPSLAALDTDRGGLELLAAVGVYKTELVVIDTVSRAVGGEENENDTWLRFYRSTGVRLKAAGVACVRLDHAGKDASKGQRGGSAKSGDVDIVWRLGFVTESLMTLVCEANRLPVPEKVVTFERRLEPNLHSFVAGRDGRRARAPEVQVDALVKLMDELALPLETGFRNASRALRDSGHGFANDVLRAALRTRKSLGVMPLLPVTETPEVTPVTEKGPGHVSEPDVTSEE